MLFLFAAATLMLLLAVATLLAGVVAIALSVERASSSSIDEIKLISKEAQRINEAAHDAIDGASDEYVRSVRDLVKSKPRR